MSYSIHIFVFCLLKGGLRGQNCHKIEHKRIILLLLSQMNKNKSKSNENEKKNETHDSKVWKKTSLHICWIVSVRV